MRTACLEVGPDRIDVDVAERRVERARGLIGRPAGRALFIPDARSVHTFGMRRPIDVVLLDADLRVLAAVTMRPRRLLLPRRKVRHVLEMDRSTFEPGTRIRLVEIARGEGSTRPPHSPPQ